MIKKSQNVIFSPVMSKNLSGVLCGKKTTKVGQRACPFAHLLGFSKVSLSAKSRYLKA
jgi:hypothetical protein